MFRRAAYYDSQAAHVPFQAIKEGGNRNALGVDPDEFKRIIAVGIGEGSGGIAAEGPQQSGVPNQQQQRQMHIDESNSKAAARSKYNLRGSSQTDEGQQVLNIGIVEIQATGRSSSTNQIDGADKSDQHRIV